MATNDSIDSANIPLPLSHGGLGANITPSNGGILYTNATTGAVLANTATANQPLLSGASGAPGWSTATYPGSTTINRILYSSANNVIGQIASANSAFLATDGSGVPSMITAAAALIQMGAVGAVRTQAFTATGAGTYTPSTGMIACLVIAVGAGGGGGACSATNLGSAAGGGGGGTSIGVFSAATIGASKALSVGALGAGGAAGFNPGATGGNTTFGPAGSLLVANGGAGGTGSNGGAAVAGVIAGGGAGGTATTGTINFSGSAGADGVNYGIAAGSQFQGGHGGNSFFGGATVSKSGDGAGAAAAAYGAGGGGSVNTSSTASAGGNGSNGVIYVIEFCNQ